MGLSRLSPLRFSTPSSRNWLAWIAWLFALTLAGLTLGLYAGSYSISLGPRWGPRGFMIAFAVLFSTMGVVVATRRPRNRIGWIYLAAGILSAIQGLGEEYAAYALLARPGSLPGGVWMAWLQNWIWVPVVGLYLGYIPLLLPEGHLASPRWRPMAWFTGFATLALSFFFATSPGRLDNFYPVVNPLGMERAPVLWARLEAGALGLLALAVLAAAASLVWRARRAGPSERQQLKWVALAGALGAGGMVASFGLGFGLGQYAGLNALLVLGGISGMHLATVVAILRYRLYDIDVFLNRALVYGLLTAALAGIYFAGVVALQRLALGLTGERQSELVTVLSTLALAALAAPLRKRIQNTIDRRFFRRKYDTAKALAQFSHAMQADPQADIHGLCQDLTDAVQEALEPASVSLWLRPAKGSAPYGAQPPQSSRDGPSAKS